MILVSEEESGKQALPSRSLAVPAIMEATRDP